MSRLLVPLTAEALEAIDTLMAGDDSYRAGHTKDRARAVGDLLVEAADLARDHRGLRADVGRLRESEGALHRDLVTVRVALQQAATDRDRLQKALQAERADHAATRLRLRNARAMAARIRGTRKSRRESVNAPKERPRD